MAEAYHNEALRKQRVIDRALEARQRLELPQHKVNPTNLFCHEYS